MTPAQVVSVFKTALSLVAISAVWAWLFWTQFQTLFATEEEGDGEVEGLEALRWLRHCPEGGGLSPQRFRHPGEAVAFVDRLYRLGAAAVLVAAVREGGRAGGLLIEVPTGGAARRRLFAAVAEEAGTAGLLPERDEGQSYLRLWWDE